MSDAPQHNDDDGPHEGPIKTPKQLMTVVVASFVVPVIAIILLVNYVAVGKQPGAGSDAFSDEAIAQRLQKVGSIEIRDPGNLATLRSGEQVYMAQCTACHATGAAGAPKSGDSAAWAPRLKTGYDALLNSALKGKGAMGPQGGGDFSDFEIARAVVFMANKAGGTLAEPALPAAAASAAAGATGK